MKSSLSDSTSGLNLSQLKPEEISNDLRREIWNATRELLLSERNIRALGTYLRPDDKYYFYEDTQRFIERVWGKLSKRPEDEIDTSYRAVMFSFKIFILKRSSNKEVLDFVKIMVNDRKYGEKFVNCINESSESLKIMENPTRIPEQAKSNISQKKMYLSDMVVRQFGEN